MKLSKVFNSWGIIVLCLMSARLYGQQIDFTQYNLVSGRNNPSWITSDNNLRVSVLHRRENIADYAWKSNYFSFSTPILVRNKMPVAGILVSFLDDKFEVDQTYAHKNVTLGFSYSIWTTQRSYLMLGIGSGLNNNKIDLGSFTTGSQYVKGLGYDPSLPSNESYVFYNKNYMNILGGIQYIVKDSLGTNKAKFGIGITDFTARVIDENQRQVRYLGFNFNGSYRLYSKNTYQLTGEVFLQSFQNVSLFNAGLVNSFLIGNGSKDNSISFTARYNSNGSIAGIIGAVYNSFALGLSYQTAIFNNSKVVNNNVTEISLSYLVPFSGKNKKWKKGKKSAKKRKIVRKKSKKKIVSKKTIPKEINKVKSAVPVEKETRDSQELQKDSIVDFPIMENVITDTIQSDRVNKEDILVKGRVLSEHSKSRLLFNNNSPEIVEQSYDYLNEIFDLIQSDSTVKLLIIGHTDDLGDEKSNLKLSIARADAVRDYLVRKNIDPERIDAKGMGESQPLVPNMDENTRSRNRRVEIILFR